AGSGIVDGGHNFATEASCGLGAGDGVDPKLDPAGLADHGGPTQTIALLPDSPAIDARDDAPCAAAPLDGVDPPGPGRPLGPHRDIGAFEAPARATTTTPTTSTTSTSTSTTSTTVPAGCADTVTLAAVACRLDELRTRVDALVPEGKIRTKLDAKLNAAKAKIGKAVGLVGQEQTKPAGKDGKRALGGVRGISGRARGTG